MFQKTKNNIINITIVFCCVALGIAIILYNLNDNIIYFYPPSALDKAKSGDNKIRIGGIVKPNSVISLLDQNIAFIITDNIQEIKVYYRGMLPALFREGQGVVAEGKLISENEFTATTLLTKHDENYKPPNY
ncbi:MAG: cytochrome c maturation protein CcmE [Rickettsiaceae bacterium]|nr:cytochrome c maturation protein CcmE [Rickettsiaceae bacterium]